MSVLKKNGVELMRKMVTGLPVQSFGLDRFGVWALKHKDIEFKKCRLIKAYVPNCQAIKV